MKGRGGKRPVNARERQGKKMFLMILPFLILCFLFSYFPLRGWIYAFYDYKAPDVYKRQAWKLLFICLITTILTFAATAGSIKLTLKLMRKKKGGE